LQQSPQAENWSFCRDIKNVTDTPLIVISNRATARDCVKAINAGADFFMRKPFGPLEFSARIHSLLQRNIPVRQALPIG
jgi:DNA-binding response OmpR family regulator